MPSAARLSDPTTHGMPLAPGPCCTSVRIGYLPAWRALPASVASAMEEISNTVSPFMKRPQMTPADATPSVGEICGVLVVGSGVASAAGAVAATGAAAAAVGTLVGTNVALTATWTAASAAPGGQPAANIAYTEGIKVAVAAAAAATVSAMASLSDMHVCPLPCPPPPHGPGFVTKGSGTVNIGGLPAARMGDKVFEACGGTDPIAMGCPTVNIGD